MTAREPLPYDWADLRQRLQQALPSLLDRLGLHDELRGARGSGMIHPRNPTRDDRTPGSFVIWTGGAAAGGWKDYALGDKAKGDVFDLIAYVLRLRGKMDAYWWALDFLGLPRALGQGSVRTQTDAEQERRRRDADRLAAEAKQVEDDEAKSAALKKLWLSLPQIAGTPAETYLRAARGIPLERLERAPGALRWADQVEYINQTTGEVTVWRSCMVAAMTRGSHLVALHRTYLKADGSGKAALDKPKLMIGPVRGSAIRLSSGPSGLSPAKAAAAGKSGPLAIGEGIETCLTVAAARPDYRVWAAGSLSLMGLLDWPDCASAVVLLGENDWKPEARRAFGAIEGHWRKQAQGRPVVVVHPDSGSDFNDVVRG